MGLKHAYKKGANFERKVKEIFEKAGYEVVRSAGSYSEADLMVKGIGTVQCKALKNFAGYRLKGKADILVVKANYKQPLVVLELNLFLKLLKRCEK